MVETPARLKVAAWWYSLSSSERPRQVTTMDVAEAALDMLPGQIKDGDLMRVGHALRKMMDGEGNPGFVRERDKDGARAYRYRATEALLNAPTSLVGRVPKRGGMGVVIGKDAVRDPRTN